MLLILDSDVVKIEHTPTTTTTTTTTLRPTESAVKQPYHNVRLPDIFKPIHYNVSLDVNMKTKDVNGNTTIDVKITRQTKFIFVHGFGYTSLSGELRDINDQVISFTRQFEYVKNHYHVMEFENAVQPGSYVLKYQFSYQLKKKLAGFYQASYKTSSGDVE